ncbi:PAS/PAC sensor signal transduction histidine kinase [Oscillochloris trichoides DG-6]|uniref:histidine kinase n=1 Tax=Oscillochloris trichoides DG-6 TaxID=765420 RepID=E1IEU9_9CHLR|nr:ATP-binding protein [Oscillochloris trichoides]EFO80296.1 PAS/PAC sensor signal transduction histidine kinase [Oscillochloris trichoides DG-6]
MSSTLIDPAITQTRLPFLLLDAQGCFVYLNPAAEALFAQPTSALLGHPFAEVVDAYSQEKASILVEETLTEGITYDWELNHPRPNAAPTLVTYTAWVWHTSPAAAPGVALIGRPLDAALSLASQLASTNQQLEGALLQLERTHAALKETQVQLVRSEKMRALGQLVAGVAHEVNTPLAFVANNLEFLQSSLETLRQLHQSYHDLLAHNPDLVRQQQDLDAQAEAEQIWADLDDILPESREGVTRIATIVKALRTFARPDETGIIAADLNSGLTSTVRIARSSAPVGLKIYEEYGPLPKVVCNPSQINQVVLNLLTNAIQAVQGSGEIHISSQQHDQQVEICVVDTGVGMDAATLAHLGEPFFTTRAVGTGTGLGIAISRGIIERHGGKLEFQSSPGQGTTARIVLPVG